MELILYEGFKKRRNSTLRPSSAGTTYDVKLKAPTNMDNPTFILNGQIKPNTSYAKFIGNYYYIDSISSIANNLWEIVCSMDELATFKTDIGNYVGFIAYSSTGYDVNIIDPRLNQKVTNNFYSIERDFPLLNKTGLYVLSIINKEYDNHGLDSNMFGSQYLCNKVNLNRLRNAMMSTDMLSAVEQSVFSDYFQTVIDCKWMPLNDSLATNPDFADTYSKVVFGDVAPILNGEHVGVPSLKANSTWVFDEAHSSEGSTHAAITIPIHWDTHTDFRRAGNYNSLSLFIPLYGTVVLNTADFVTSSNVIIEGAVDVSTGDVSLKIKNEFGYISQIVNYNIACSYPIAKVGANGQAIFQGAVGYASGFVDMGAGAVSGNIGSVVKGASSSLSSGITAGVGAIQRTSSIKGSIQGKSMIELGLKFRLTIIQQDLQPIDTNYIALQGLPVMKYGKVSDHPGFIQMANASISIAGLRSEGDAINNMLNAGIYYE